MNWDRIRKDYIAGKGSYRELSAKYGVPLRTLADRAKAENWVQLREQARDKAVTKTVDAVADSKSIAGKKIYDAAIALIDKTMDGIQAIDPEQAKALKSYSGVLRDLQEVLDLRPDLDIREQEARIEKLRRDAEKDTDAGTEIAIEIGEAAEWAK